MDEMSIAVIDLRQNAPLVYSLKYETMFTIGYDAEEGYNIVLQRENWQTACTDFVLGICRKENGRHVPLLLSRSNPTVFVNGKPRNLKVEDCELEDGDLIVVGCCRWRSEPPVPVGPLVLQYKIEPPPLPPSPSPPKKTKNGTKAPKKRPTRLHDLPEDALAEVFSHLDPCYVTANLAAVCDKFFRACKARIPFREFRIGVRDTAVSCPACRVSTFLPVMRKDCLVTLTWVAREPDDGSSASAEACRVLLSNVGTGLRSLQVFDNGLVRAEVRELLKRSPEVVRFEWRDEENRVDVSALPPSKRLETLTLTFSHAVETGGGDGGPFLAGYPGLRSLVLKGSLERRFWDSVRAGHLARLTRFGVVFSLAVPFRLAGGVRHLALFKLPGQGFENLRATLPRFPALESLYLEVDQDSNVQPFGVGVGSSLGKLPPGLRVFAASFPRFTDGFCRVVARRCPRLEVFFCDAPGVTADGVARLVAGCPRLRCVSLNHGPRVTSDRASGAARRYDASFVVPDQLRKCRSDVRRELSECFGVTV